MIVADTCLIIHLFNRTSLTETAQRVLDKDSHWIMPTIWQTEYANVLAKLARKENKNIKDVLEHFSYTVNELKDYETSVDIKRALTVASDHKISVYDAHFVLLAIDSNTFVVTEDKEILKKCPQYSKCMVDFLC